MQVIGLFVVFVAILDAIGIGICSIVENYSENVSLLVFLALYAVNFVIAWKAAVYFTERYLMTGAQKNARDHPGMAPTSR